MKRGIMIKRTVLSVLILGIILGSIGATENPFQNKTYQKFLKHIADVYEANMRATMSKDQLRQFILNANNNARIYGYALSNQLRFAKRETDEYKIFKELERICRLAVSETAKRLAKKEGWSEQTQKQREKTALREFEAATFGWHDGDMARITGVRPENVPNFFATIDLASALNQTPDQNNPEITRGNIIPPQSEIVNPGVVSDAILGKWTIQYTGRYDIPENNIVVVVRRGPGDNRTVYEGHILEVGEDMKRNGFRPGQLFWKLTYKGQPNPNKLGFSCQQYDRHQTGPENERGYFHSPVNLTLNMETQTVSYGTLATWRR